MKAYPRVYWIAGGRAKSDGIGDLEPLFPRVAKAYLIGEAQDAFTRTLKGKAPVAKCGTIETAVQMAWADAKASGEPDPVILLSPACASFDQLRDFESRGNAFKAIVSDMIGADSSTELMETA